MKSQKQTPPTKKPRFSLRLLITNHKITFTVLAALLAIILIADISDRIRFAGVERELVTVNNNIMKPAGAIENAPMTGQGNGLWEKIACGTDVYCPYVRQGWVVPVDPGQEEEFIESILYKAGYGPKPEDVKHPCALMDNNDDMCSEKGKNANYQMDVSIYYVDARHHRIPEIDVTPRQWRYVDIWIDPVSK